MFLKASEKRSAESTEPEKVVVEEAKPEPKKIEIPYVLVGPVMRLKISLDFALYKRLKKAGLWWKYHDLHRWRDGRLVCADCDTCKKLGQQSGMRRVYGKAPKIVFKCLKCGAEQLVEQVHNWQG
jgi:hypothetical protein